MRGNSGPVIAAIVLYLVLCLLGYFGVTRQSGGRLVYTIDDPYIHMAVAKNLSEHSVWGVNPDSFSSASSSLLWTLLLTGVYHTLGPSESAPLALNVLFGVILLVLIGFLIARHEVKGPLRVVTLMAVVCFTPLTAIAFTGMEHILHLFVSVIFLFAAALVICTEHLSRGKTAILLITACLLTGIRYEGFLMIAVAVILLFLRRKYLTGMLVLIASLIPALIYGMYSVSNGGYFLPNSVLLKAAPDIYSIRGVLFFFYYGFRQLYESPHLLLLLLFIIGGMTLAKPKRGVLADRIIVMSMLYIGTTLLHLLFARTGWFYRYEAYLVGLGIIITGIIYHAVRDEIQSSFSSRPFGRYMKVLLVLIMLAPFLFRFAQSTLRIKQASRNIYEQQYQMGLFVDKYFSGAGIAAHDIGAISWLADFRLLDLFGLAGFEVAESKLNGTYNAARVAILADSLNIDIAIVHDNWFNRDEMGAPPQSWFKAGSWRITQNKISAGDIVTFYSVNPDLHDSLVDALRGFSGQLPSAVIETGIYRDSM